MAMIIPCDVCNGLCAEFQQINVDDSLVTCPDCNTVTHLENGVIVEQYTDDDQGVNEPEFD
jgi:hypothetical protein